MTILLLFPADEGRRQNWDSRWYTRREIPTSKLIMVFFLNSAEKKPAELRIVVKLNIKREIKPTHWQIQMGRAQPVARGPGRLYTVSDRAGSGSHFLTIGLARSAGFDPGKFFGLAF